MNKNLYTLLLYVLLAVCGGAVGRDCHAAGGRAVGKYGDVLLRLHALSLDQLLARGDSLYARCAFDSALLHYTVALGRYSDALPEADKLNCAYASLNAGRIYFMQYDYMQAQSVFLRGLEMCNGLPDDRLTYRLLNDLGNIYAVFNDYRTAYAYFHQAYAHALSAGADSLSYAPVLGNLLGVCFNLRDTTNLARYLAVVDSLPAPDPMIRVLGLLAHGGLDRERHDYATALRLQQQAYALADSCRLAPNYLCSSLNNMAETYLLQRRYAEAEGVLRKSLRLAEQNGLLDLQSIIYDELATVYDKRNDVAAFARYMRLHRQIADSIKNMQDYHNIKNIERQYEMARLNKYIDQLSTERVIRDERLRNQLLILCVVVAALVVAVVLLLMVYRQKQKLEVSYEAIFRRNQEIVASEQQAKAVYHRYKSELQARDAELQRLRSAHSLAAPAPSGEARPATQVDEPAPPKYQGSNLTRGQKDELLRAIGNVMEDTLEFCNPDFTLEKMAALVQSKPRYVSQVINESYGKTFNRFVNEYRIKEARIRLADRTGQYAHFTVKAIAQSLGFKSNTNFNALFKELTGITPSMYQDMARH